MMRVPATPAFGVQKGIFLKARFLDSMTHAPAEATMFVEFAPRKPQVSLTVLPRNTHKIEKKDFSLQRGLYSAQKWLFKLDKRAQWHD